MTTKVPGRMLADAVLAGIPFNPQMFGATPGNTIDSAPAINTMFDYAVATGNHVDLLGKCWRINSPLQFRRNVQVNGGGAWILNYSGGDACVPHPSDGIVDAIVSDINVTFQDYGSPLNANTPPYTVDKTKKLGTQITRAHWATFTGDAWKHSATGRFFQNLHRCAGYYHRYGFHMLGWNIHLYECIGNGNAISGFLGSGASISGTRFPVHALKMSACVGVLNGTRGVHLQYADGITFDGGDFEKNYTTNVLLEGIRGSDGFVYVEYGKDAVTTLDCQDIRLGVYAGGNKAAYVPFAKSAHAYYEQTLSGGSLAVTVTAYNGGTQIGIDNFASIPDSEIAVVRNSKYVLSTGWSRVGSVVTLASGADGDVVVVLANAYLDPATDTTAIHDRYELGTEYFWRVQHTRNSTVGGYGGNFIDGTLIVNDFDPGSLPLSTGNRIDAELSNTTKVVQSAVSYPWQNGFYNQQNFFAGWSLKNQFDSNQNITGTGMMAYPGSGATGTINLGTNAHRGLWYIVGAAGCAMFVIDAQGDLTAGPLNGDVFVIANANGDVASRLNIFKSAANVIGFKNNLGFATQLSLLKIAG